MFDGATYTDAPTKQADIFSLEGLRDWLRTQPPQKMYNFNDCFGGCLLGQYLAARGVGRGKPGYDYPRMADVATGIAGGSHISVACAWPRTIGAALARCEALIAAQEKF